MLEEKISDHLPGTWRRLAANAIDEIFMLPLYAPFFRVLWEMFFGENEVRISLPRFILLLMIPAIYEFVFLFLMQATPAKWLLGLKVVPARGMDAPLSWQQCLLRTLGKRLSLFLSSAIYALAFFRFDRTHAADWIAETRVVQITARSSRPKIRGFIGSVLFIYFCIEGWSAATEVAKSISWTNNDVNLSQITEAYEFPEE